MDTQYWFKTFESVVCYY